MTFDPESRLTAYESALTASYTGDGLRAWKQNSVGRTYFLYDGDEPVCELSSTGAVAATNTFGDDGLLSRRSDSTSVFYTFDPSGNTAQRLSSAQAVLSCDMYDAFGTPQSTGGADVFGFGAQWEYYSDTETGLYLCGHRYYDLATGRWLTRDPFGYAGGVDLYEDVQNNPVNRMDSFGLWPDAPYPSPPSPSIIPGTYYGHHCGARRASWHHGDEDCIDNAYESHDHCLDKPECASH